MKKAYLLLPLALCACDRNQNPECLKHLKEVQVIDMIGDANNGPAALAVNCNKKMAEGCIGDTVLLPKGFRATLEIDQKIKAPRHHCFVSVGEYGYTRKDGVQDKVPVVEFRYNKKTLTASDIKDIVEDGYNRIYVDCLHYAGIEFKDTKLEDNEKACKCFSDYMWNGYKELFSIQDLKERAAKQSVFSKNFHKYIRNNCGKVPAKTLREMPNE